METFLYKLILLFVMTVYLQYASGKSCYNSRLGRLTKSHNCKSCRILVNTCGSLHQCLHRSYPDNLQYKDGVLFYTCNVNLCNYVIPLPTVPTKQILQNEITSSTATGKSRRFNGGKSCYNSRLGRLTKSHNCKSCRILVNTCGSLHQCLHRSYPDDLQYKDGVLFYTCNVNLCNYVIPLPTAPTKQILQNEITSSTATRNSRRVNGIDIGRKTFAII